MMVTLSMNAEVSIWLLCLFSIHHTGQAAPWLHTHGSHKILPHQKAYAKQALDFMGGSSHRPQRWKKKQETQAVGLSYPERVLTSIFLTCQYRLAFEAPLSPPLQPPSSRQKMWGQKEESKLEGVQPSKMESAL